MAATVIPDLENFLVGKRLRTTMVSLQHSLLLPALLAHRRLHPRSEANEEGIGAAGVS